MVPTVHLGQHVLSCRRLPPCVMSSIHKVLEIRIAHLQNILNSTQKRAARAKSATDQKAAQDRWDAEVPKPIEPFVWENKHLMFVTPRVAAEGHPLHHGERADTIVHLPGTNSDTGLPRAWKEWRHPPPKPRGALPATTPEEAWLNRSTTKPIRTLLGCPPKELRVAIDKGYGNIVPIQHVWEIIHAWALRSKQAVLIDTVRNFKTWTNNQARDGQRQVVH
jgi:hypothetical protein